MRASVWKGLVTFLQFEFILDLRIFYHLKFQNIRSVMMLLLACSMNESLKYAQVPVITSFLI